MKYLATIIFAVSGLFGSALAQSPQGEIRTAEFVSPIGGSAVRDRACFSFVDEKFVTGSPGDICFGGLRAGEQWDWFQVTGVGMRNKIKNIGRKDWNRDFKIPVVEPYAVLPVGRQRNIALNSSPSTSYPPLPSATSQPETPGEKNFDISAPQRFGEVNSARIANSDYNPYLRAQKGKSYVVRVVNETNDFYVLMRVDELERGKRCVITWKRIDAPRQD